MILDEIVADKRIEVERRKREMPLSELQRRGARRQPLDFGAALRGTGTRLIAEVKKASPSKGLLCPDFDPVKLAKTYAENGAAAISIITETPHFQGSLDYLSAIRQAVDLPLLRKDFIFDAYQVYEAAACGADALLLIAAILSGAQLKDLLALSQSLGLDCLVEVHNKTEVAAAVAAGAGIIGINNRDLATFKVAIETTRRLRLFIPPDKIVVSESGISRREDVEKVAEWGVNAVLVGEALVTAKDVAAKVKELVS